ncbi:MAG: HD domain-containing protein [Thermoleophilia bacterium]|nr:HD domain-containing protein [Thermoleophilia bacterium]
MENHQLDLDAAFVPDPEERNCSARIAVRDLAPGMQVEGVYLLSAKEVRLTKTGKPYYRLKLSDRTGAIECTIWEVEAVEGDIQVGELVSTSAQVTEYQGKRQLVATRIAPAPEGIAQPEDFLPSTYRDIEELKGFLRFHIDSVYDRHYNSLLNKIFGDRSFFEAFCRAPAAKEFHHAYLGGLLEHTVSVAALCEFVGQQYARVDHDLLLTGALLHDIGKVEELSYETAFDYTDAGRFLGHVIQGVTLVSEKAKLVPGFPQPKLHQLLHCIVSHHGELEWGSPKQPQTLEALILHHVDNLDAKVKGFLEIVEGSRNVGWTDVRNLFRRPLHIPRANTQEEDFLPPTEDEADLPR